MEREKIKKASELLKKIDILSGDIEALEKINRGDGIIMLTDTYTGREMFIHDELIPEVCNLILEQKRSFLYALEKEFEAL